LFPLIVRVYGHCCRLPYLLSIIRRTTNVVSFLAGKVTHVVDIVAMLSFLNAGDVWLK